MPNASIRLLSSVSLLLFACNDDVDPLDSAGADPGLLGGPCVEGKCFAGFACLSNICVDPGGGSGGDPSGGDPSGDPGGGPGGDPTEGPTGGTSVGPGGDPTGDTTSGPTSDPTVTGGPGPTSDSDATTDPPMTTGEPGNCQNLQLKPPPTNLIFVVDRSSSFSAVMWDHDGNFGTPDVSKWSSLHKTLTSVIGKYQAQHKLGLMMFPSNAAMSAYSSAACVTDPSPEVTPALGNAAALAAALPPANAMLKGATPMARGLSGALSSLQSAPPSEARAMVLIGDGSPNCSVNAPDNAGLLEVLDTSVHGLVGGAWSNSNIATTVVGVDLSDSYSQVLVDGNPDNANPVVEFNKLAEEGGRPRSGGTKFYDAHDESELGAYLDEAVRATLGCELNLVITPGDPAATVVTVGGTNYPYSPNLDCAAGDGWVYTNGNNSRVRLCGAACDALISSGGAQVDVDCS
ncbi:hypothetical protein [Nannocystis radixulma]|uniref:VWFA domain-containing protein n=1 Tax=Nannocystis radixulma TaxID=2995305 RepID=A0ABT5BAV6_9BACT|nr:hypothetical protein [Nannocystis radixulma]MDC0670583.1 hypothetical protein [Nannocystis radixulma]